MQMCENFKEKVEERKNTMSTRSPSHAAKFKTPTDRVWEFGNVLGERDGRLVCLVCRSCVLDHTRRSTIVEHLRFATFMKIKSHENTRGSCVMWE
ncbi:CGG triplet repeat-binding protein 1-like [Oratosquilla oratoria]|uniref:CGG triplet repeat-binding protein 1-like n=1 Tax=Oratosquilla oratoria TaxID=337810 RepID=UPI003F7720C3